MGLGRAILAGVAAVCLSGCAGYNLGPMNGQAAGGRSVQVKPFFNQTLEPHLGDDVTVQVRKELQRNGTYHLTSADDGDIVVNGVLISYIRIPLAFQPADALTATDYSVRATAHVTARERGSGKVLLDQNVSGTTLVIVGSDLTSAERQARPLLAADLAKNVTALLTEGSW